MFTWFRNGCIFCAIQCGNWILQARLLVPGTVLQQILSLNSLDVELYKHAQEIFMQQQKHLTQNAQDNFMQHQGQLMAEGVSPTSY